MHTKALPYVGLLSFFWGTNIVASRFGIDEFDPVVFIALRLAIATVFFVLIFLLQRRALPTDGRVWRHAAISGVIGVAIPMNLFILSLQFQSSGMAAIFVTITPAMMALAAHTFLPDERMTTYKALGVMLALSGSLFLALRGESGLAGVGRASPLGFGLVFIGLCSEVTNAIFVRKRMRDMDPVSVTGIRLLTGALVTGTVAVLLSSGTWHNVTPAGLFSLGYASLVGALGGQFLAFYITRRFGATAFSLTSYLIPVVATVFGVLILGEIVTWGMVVGVVLIGSGVYLINRPGRVVYA
ncbi:MAG: DMT family transporter [Caldilineaceae bacterium]|nr:DMT family transporter [Caldilineaceae bacterium]